jgi:hypothetical protein
VAVAPGGRRRLRFRTAVLAAVVVAAVSCMPRMPEGIAPASFTRPILEKTARMTLAPDLSGLPASEREVVRLLLEAGAVMQELHERELHHDADRARAGLEKIAPRLEPKYADDLFKLYRLNQGPIATTLDNQRVPFLPVDSLVPGKNMYPWGVTRQEMDADMAAHPESRVWLLHPRTVVRRATAASYRADLNLLTQNPGLRMLHPDVEAMLRAGPSLQNGPAFYAVPYSLAWSNELTRISALLFEAAHHAEATDRDFASFLRHRARDLLANDYEAGDASWVLGRFGRLNAQIGADETYDDELYGVKAGHALSLMLTDSARTAAVRNAARGLQQMENSLPYEAHKRVREDISIGVYDVIADFGQSRGVNTASILPNEQKHVARYGRTILMRRNIIMDPSTVAGSRATFEAAVDPKHLIDFDPEGNFYRTLWHELGHYLGPDLDVNGRTLDLALEEESGTFEEMKADLVALYLVPMLRGTGFYDEHAARAVYASGINRMLNKNRPRPDQVYSVMQNMQLNWFLDRGALKYDPATSKLVIDNSKYHDAVASLLHEVMAIQRAGDKARAVAFIDRWNLWDDRHEKLAAAMKAAEPSRFRLVRYAAIDK